MLEQHSVVKIQYACKLLCFELYNIHQSKYTAWK